VRVDSTQEIERKLRRHPAVIAGRRAVAEEVIDVARGLAAESFKGGDRRPGRISYVSGLTVREGPDGDPMASATAPHSPFLEAGTGVYGPKRKMVEAGSAGKVFSFRIGGEQIVVRKQKGTKPKRIMQRAGQIVGSRPGARFTRRRPWRYTA
jgi:hypothetical protein